MLPLQAAAHMAVTRANFSEASNSKIEDEKEERDEIEESRAMKKSNAMNQFCCQIRTSDSKGLMDSLYTIRNEDGCKEGEEYSFLQDGLCDL